VKITHPTIYILLASILMAAFITRTSHILAMGPNKLHQFSDNGFLPKIPERLTSIGGFRADIIKRFGSPVSTESLIKPDIQDPGLSYEYVTWKYDGITITTSTPLPSKSIKYWIEKIVLYGEDYLLLFGLRISEPKSKFVKELGKPSKEINNTLYYDDVYYRRHVYLSINFDKNERAKEIIWIYGIGH